MQNGIVGTLQPVPLQHFLFDATRKRDAYKKQLEAVVNDGETYTMAGMAFSGNANHLTQPKN